MKKLPSPPRAVKMAVIGVLLLPFIPLLVTFTPFVTVPGYFVMAFQKLFARSDLIESLFRSLRIAFSSSTLALVVAGAATYLVEKRRDPLVKWTLHLSMAMPEIVLGISLLLTFSMIGLTPGVLTVTLAHASFTYAFATLILRSHCQNLDPKIFEAARDLGATSLQSIIRITLPLFATSIASAFLLCITLSLDDYLISAFNSGAGQDTLPMKIYSLLRYGFGPELKAISLVLFLISLSFVFIGLRILLRRGKTSSDTGL